MTAVKRWAAAGSSAAVLAGGLFLGAPAAVAAPDDACLAASAQAYSTMTGADMGQEGTARILEAAAAVHAAGTHFRTLVTDAGTLAALQSAEADLEAAMVNEDPQSAEKAWYRVLDVQKEAAAASDSVELARAYQASADSAAAFDAAVRSSPLRMGDSSEMLAMFYRVVSSCQDVGSGPVSTGEVLAAEDPGRNQGINMQTAEEGQRPGAGLLAGVLVAVATLVAATALWLRRGRA